MTRYLLDSDIASYFANKHHPAHQHIVTRMSELSDEDTVYLSVITVYEMYFSLENVCEYVAKYNAFHKAVQSLTRSFEVLPLYEHGAQIYGTLKTAYKRHTGIAGKALSRHNIDVILASVAVANDAILVSNDQLFSTLAALDTNLKLENWAEEAKS